MFRLSNLLKSVTQGKPSRILDGSIAIWNFTNRCNLSCLHCYSKADLDAVDTLTTEHIMDTLPKLKANGIKFLIFSGGEPLTRTDIYEIAARCKSLGIVTYLSTNGLYVKKSNAEQILDTFDYIGISIDGSEKVHDAFRGLKGSFRESMKAVNLLNSYGRTKVGIRFTITKDTYDDLAFIFELAEKHDIPKIYISHLVYSGRGLDNLEMDLSKEQRITAVNYILDKAFEYHEFHKDIEIVTGNMEMDAILFYDRFIQKYPEHADEMKSRLITWGGNSAGRKLLNIDSEGNVKPDPFFPVTIGNILEQDFSDIWTKKTIGLLKKLRVHPREIGGKCETCQYLNICNGGSRSRAYAIHEDIWAEDPSCYLSEIKTRGESVNGKVYLTGAGPGDIELLTVKALRVVKEADVIIYDRLANPDILHEAKDGCKFIYVGKEDSHHTLPQEEINEVIYQNALKYKTVVRLKGGDPFVFGRGGEEGIYLYERNIKFEFIPGITSAIAVPEYAGIPVTHRGVTVSFRVVTGHESKNKEHTQIPWENYKTDDTIVFLMGLHRLEKITKKLIKIGKPKNHPIAVISRGTRPDEKTIIGTLENIYEKAKNLPTPALIIVGEVVNLHKQLNWFEK